MFRKTLIVTALAALFSNGASAAVSPDEAKQLGTTLTAVGAEKAGNTDGTIPEYAGGIKPPADFKPGSGFRPDLMHKMLHKVFECEPPCMWNGHNKVLFKNLLEGPAKPDAYLVTMTYEQSGGIDKERNGTWLHNGAQLISFSECRDQQEVMVVMPPFSWLRGRLGTFLLEPDTRKPWEARLILSAAI